MLQIQDTLREELAHQLGLPLARFNRARFAAVEEPGLRFV